MADQPNTGRRMQPCDHAWRVAGWYYDHHTAEGEVVVRMLRVCDDCGDELANSEALEPSQSAPQEDSDG